MTTDHLILVHISLPEVGPADCRDYCPFCGEYDTYEDQEFCATCQPHLEGEWDSIGSPRYPALVGVSV